MSQTATEIHERMVSARVAAEQTMSQGANEIQERMVLLAKFASEQAMSQRAAEIHDKMMSAKFAAEQAVVAARAAAEQAAIPSLFRKDRAELQRLIIVPIFMAALVLKFPFQAPPLPTFEVDIVATLEEAVSMVDKLGALVFLLFCLYIGAAVQEALQFPKLAAHATGRQQLRTLMQMMGDILLIPVYAVLPAEVPMLGYQHTMENLKILEHCPSLRSFKQTPWANNAWHAFTGLMIADVLCPAKVRKSIRRELLTAPDGGVVALDWWGEAASPPAANPRGVLFVNSTLIGDATPFVVRKSCERFYAAGWRVVIFVKRGCGSSMPNVQRPTPAGAPMPAPWCFANRKDVEFAIDHVARECPGVPMCGIGFSTGAAQLQDYVCRAGRRCKFSAAVIMDVAEDWEECISSGDQRVPFLSQALHMAVAETFRACGYGLFERQPRESHDPDVVPGGMIEFVRDVMAPAHGFDRTLVGAQEYLRSCKPASFANCAIPVMVLTTPNDTLATAEMSQVVQAKYKISPHVVTVMTRQGTHMIRWEGWWPRCWVSRVSGEFIESALQQVVGIETTAPPTVSPDKFVGRSATADAK